MSGQVEETDDLLDGEGGAQVLVEPVALMLRLQGPEGAVTVGQTYTVTVDTAEPVPAGTTLAVTVTVSDGSDPPVQMRMLTAAIPSMPVSFTAPVRAGSVTVTATARAETSTGSRQVAVSDAATLTVGVSAREVQLALSEVPMDLVAAESTFSVTVGAAPEVPATTVQVTVRLAAFSSEPVLLTPGAPTASVLVMAPMAGGSETLLATGEEAADSRLELNVLPAQATVRVQAEGTVQLTVNAPGSVTVGDTFTVTVGVAAETPLAEGVSVTATVSFRTAGGEEIQAETVVLTAMSSSATRVFTAPVTAGTYTLAVSGQVEETDDLRVTVTGASTSVTAEPVALMLRLRGPEGAVTVGSTFPVTVGVAAQTPLAVGLSVSATVSFRAADGEEIQAETVVLTAMSSSDTRVFTAPVTAGTYTVAVSGSNGTSLLVISATDQVTVEPVLVLDVPSAPIYRGVMFPVRVRLLGGLLEDNGSVGVTVYLRDAVTDAVVLTRTATLSTAASSMVLTFEAVAGEAMVTPYSLTTEDIDQAGLAPMTNAVLSLQSAAMATVLVTRINADLSGNGVFDADDALLIARGLLTENYLARSAGGLTELDPDTFQARLSELADFADISGDDKLDIIDAVFLVRNVDATVSDLQSRVMTDDNPFAYLCGGLGRDACDGRLGPHGNIMQGGIRYEAIGEVLDRLRGVPPPPTLSSPNNP